MHDSWVPFGLNMKSCKVNDLASIGIGKTSNISTDYGI